MSVRLRIKWLWAPIPLQPVLSKAFLDIQASLECRLTLKRLRDMLMKYSHNILPLQKQIDAHVSALSLFQIIQRDLAIAFKIFS